MVKPVKNVSTIKSFLFLLKFINFNFIKNSGKMSTLFNYNFIDYEKLYLKISIMIMYDIQFFIKLCHVIM